MAAVVGGEGESGAGRARAEVAAVDEDAVGAAAQDEDEAAEGNVGQGAEGGADTAMADTEVAAQDERDGPGEGGGEVGQAMWAFQHVEAGAAGGAEQRALGLEPADSGALRAVV